MSVDRRLWLPLVLGLVALVQVVLFVRYGIHHPDGEPRPDHCVSTTARAGCFR